MKKHTHSNLLIHTSLALLLGVGSPLPARSVEPEAGGNMTEDTVMERCQEMKEQNQTMMEEMKTRDAEPAKEAAKIKKAPVDKQLGMIASVMLYLRLFHR